MHRVLWLLFFLIVTLVHAGPPWPRDTSWKREVTIGSQLWLVKAYLNPLTYNTILEIWDPDDLEPVPFFRKQLNNQYLYKYSETAVKAALGDRPSISFAPRNAGAVPIHNLYLSAGSPKETIHVLEPAAFGTVATIDVSPRLPGGLALSPDTGTLYATLWRSTTTNPPLPAQIAIIDTATNIITNRITLTSDMLPSRPVVSPDNKLLFFADPAEGLVVVDLGTRAVIDKIPASRAGGSNNQFHTLALCPDGEQLYLVDSFGIAVLDTRTRTFTARILISLPNREIAPAILPNGSRFYVVERRTVQGGLAVSLVAFDTSTLAEVARVDLPSTFDPHTVGVTPDGLQLAMDGLLRPTGAPASAVVMVVDLVTHLVKTITDSEPYIGAFGFLIR